MNVSPMTSQEVLKVSRFLAFATHLIPTIAVALLLFIDFKIGGRLGAVNKPLWLAAMTPLIGIGTGLLMNSIGRRPSSIAIYYAIHFVVSIAAIFLFFGVFVKDSL